MTASNKDFIVKNGLQVNGPVTVSTNVIKSVATGITSAGSVQGTAFALTKDINVISTVPSNTGVALPTAQSGMQIMVVNLGVNPLFVYPASGATVDFNSVNIPFILPVNGRMMFSAVSATQWFTPNATYA